MCNLINPQRAVVGGSVGLAGELLLEEMRDAVRRWAFASAADDVGNRVRRARRAR